MNELAAALGDDENFATNVTTLITANSTAIVAENSRALGIEGGLRADLSTAIANLAALRSDHDTLASGSSSNTENLVAHVRAIWDAFYAGTALPLRYA